MTGLFGYLLAAVAAALSMSTDGATRWAWAAVSALAVIAGLLVTAAFRDEEDQ